MGKELIPPDARIAEIGSEQHGVISIDQLRLLGLTEKTIHARVVSARLHRVHRGVYAVGHGRLSPEGRWFAAVLAIGRGPHEGETVLECWRTAVSHRTGLVLWGHLPAKSSPCDVIVHWARGSAARADIRVHRSRSLVAADVTLRRGIPVTTPARTVADLRTAISLGRSGAIPGRELRKAIRQANVVGLPLGDADAAVRTRSDLEGDFLSICRRHRLPQPEVNVPIGSYLIDFLWRDERLVVETDSYLYHRGEVAFQDDRARDLELTRLGYGVLRLSEAQIDESPKQVADALDAELRRRRDG